MALPRAVSSFSLWPLVDRRTWLRLRLGVRIVGPLMTLAEDDCTGIVGVGVVEVVGAEWWLPLVSWLAVLL